MNDLKERTIFQPKIVTYKYLKYDIPSGLVVFLVALPLCLGIALASGAPLISGLITGIVGGLVVSNVSSSQTSISGPAAGLTVIVLGAIATLGSFPAFLAAVVIAGIIQIVLAYARAGSVGNYFPTSVIKGMLAAIGIILILKQIPHAVGYDADFEGDFDFWQRDQENTFSEIFVALSKISLTAVVISIVAILVQILWERPLFKKLRMLPGPLMAVALGVVINQILIYFAPKYALSTEHLVSLPSVNNLDDLKSLVTFPDFSYLTNGKLWVVACTLAIIASLETLLSIEAVDKLDPLKRHSSPTQELKAQGIGNIISGLLGGLPMTAVIVRGSANVNAGAKTKTSGFIHSILLLLSLLFFSRFINMIPYAALAGVLLVVGYKLAKLSLFKDMYKAGWDQFLPFIVTVLAIVFTDLLKGIGIGLAVAVYYILRRNTKNPYYYVRKQPTPKDPIHLVLSEEVSFLNKASIRLTLEHLPDNSHVIIDGSRSKYIDYDVLEVIHDFRQNALHRNIKVELVDIQPIYKMETH